MITILIALISFFRRPNRFWSIGEVDRYHAKRLLEEGMIYVDICLKFYLWEEKNGIPHRHTLEELSRHMGVPLKTVQKKRERMRESVFDPGYMTRCTYLSL